MTGAGDDQSMQHRWYGFVHGDAAALMWDDKSTFVDDKGKYDKQGTESAKWHGEIASGLGRQYMAARRVDDPIAIYESQAAMRVHWVLHVRPQGPKWANRYSKSERVDNPYARVRESWIKLVEDAGLQYKMLAPQQVLAGDLKCYDPETGKGFRLLILPRTIALSTAEADAIRQFAASGGTVIADGLIGLFDEHGRRLEKGRLDDLFGISRPADEAISMVGDKPSGLKGFNLLEPAVDLAAAVPTHMVAPKALIHRDVDQGKVVYLNLDLIDYHRWRLHPGEEAAARKMMNPYFYEAIGKDRRSPRFVAEGEVPTGVEVTVKDMGGPRIISLMRNPQMMVSELGPVEYQSNEGFGKPVDVELNPNSFGQEESFVYCDMRTGKRLGSGKTVKVAVPAFEPVILSVWAKDPGEFAFAAPANIVRGNPLNIGVTPASRQARQYVYHIEVTGPDGKVRSLYRENFAFDAEGGQIKVPLALSDPAGPWTIAIREAATGLTKNVTVQVE
jgi:hypothetical protein